MANMISVNFEGVEEGFASVHVPEGDYGLKITKVSKKTGKDSGKEYLLFMFKITKGAEKGIGKTLPHTCSLTKSALWNLRNLLEACGKEIPAKAIKIDLEKLPGLECGATLGDGEYEGKLKSVVGTFFPIDELTATPASTAKNGKAADKKKEEDEETEETAGTEVPDEGGEEEEELFG